MLQESDVGVNAASVELFRMLGLPSPSWRRRFEAAVPISPDTARRRRPAPQFGFRPNSARGQLDAADEAARLETPLDARIGQAALDQARAETAARRRRAPEARRSRARRAIIALLRCSD